jgi:hypothetical protein
MYLLEAMYVGQQREREREEREREARALSADFSARRVWVEFELNNRVRSMKSTIVILHLTISITAYTLILHGSIETIRAAGLALKEIWFGKRVSNSREYHKADSS